MVGTQPVTNGKAPGQAVQPVVMGIDEGGQSVGRVAREGDWFATFRDLSLVSGV